MTVCILTGLELEGILLKTCGLLSQPSMVDSWVCVQHVNGLMNFADVFWFTPSSFAFENFFLISILLASELQIFHSYLTGICVQSSGV